MNWQNIFRVVPLLKTSEIAAEIVSNRNFHNTASLVHLEADVLNVAMFGMTAQEWRNANPDKKGNIRDYATITELICLANMEAINSEFINDQIPQAEHLMKLNRIAISQMRILSEVSGRKLLADSEAQEK